MNQSITAARQFIWKEKLALATLDKDSLVENFIQQMQQGLNTNLKASLAMLPSYLQVPQDIPLQKPLIAVDAGGSFLKVAMVEFCKDAQQHIKAALSYQQTFEMPGRSQIESKESFFKKFYQCISPLLDQSNHIGLCFSYPCEISSNKDGMLLRWTKEINAPAVKGLWIGEHLNAEIKKHHGAPKKIVLLNDTVATLLAGSLQTQNHPHDFDSHIGLILGTGTNSAYIGTHEQYKKTGIINIESGAFDGYKNTDIDNMLDTLCIDPGTYLFEKKIAGRYLGNLCLQTLKKAAQEKLFSNACCAAILATTDIESTLLNNLLLSDKASGFFHGNPNDGVIISFLIDSIIERAALLTAIQLYAAAIYTGGGKKEKAVSITIDGSTYYELNTYQEKIVTKLESLMHHKKIRYELFQVQNAPLIGAAIAALNC